MKVFNSKSFCELQFFEDRGFTFKNNRMAELLELCFIASRLNIEINPDGLIEDRDDVLNTN